MSQRYIQKAAGKKNNLHVTTLRLLDETKYSTPLMLGLEKTFLWIVQEQGSQGETRSHHLSKISPQVRSVLEYLQG